MKTTVNIEKKKVLPYGRFSETLLHEQSKRTALEVEKRKPILIHPWRILQVLREINT